MAAASTIAEPTAQRTRQLQAAPSPKTAIVAHGPILENRRLWIVATIRSFVQGSHQSGLQRNLRPAMGRPGSLGQVLRPNESENPLSAPGGRFAPPAAQRRGSGAGRCCIRSHEASIMCPEGVIVAIFEDLRRQAAEMPLSRMIEKDDGQAYAPRGPGFRQQPKGGNYVDTRDGFGAVPAMPETQPQKGGKRPSDENTLTAPLWSRPLSGWGVRIEQTRFGGSVRAVMDSPDLDLLNHR